MPMTTKLGSKSVTGPGTTIRKAEPDATPETLTHYTDLAGLKGIVENKEFWLSHAAFLNDPEELSHGMKMAKTVLTSLADKTGDELSTTARRALLRKILKDFEAFKAPDAFITCFCEEHDLLSQWRGYSSRQGVSVSFDTQKLMKVVKSQGAEIMQVHYGRVQPRKQILSQIRQHLPDIVDDWDYMITLLSDAEIREKFAQIVGAAIPRFKHLGFREENEWRLVVMNPDTGSINFRPRSQLMLPYIKLSLGKGQLPITGVTIGPGIQDEAVAKSMEYFLNKYGYNGSLVSSSETPYRS
jgi:hypothetical protein